MKVFEALHNPMTEESSAYTISLHLSKKGAQNAILESQNKVKEEHSKSKEYWISKGDELSAELYSDESWDKFQWWGINETEVLP